MRGKSLAVLLILTVPLSAQRWASDGKHLVISANKWVDPITGQPVQVANSKEAPSADGAVRSAFRDAMAAQLGDAFDARAFRGIRRRSTLPRAPEKSPGVRIAARPTGAVKGAAIVGGALWVFDGAARKIKGGLEGARHLDISPDGRNVSYIFENDLYLVRTSDGETRRLTEDGGENIFNGELDWVYQEEVYGRGNFRGTYWSRDGSHLAFLRIDENGVDTFTIVDHLPQTLAVDELKYPKAGTVNPRATLHLVRASDAKKVSADLSMYSPEDEILIVRVGSTPDGKQTVFMVQNREQTWLDLNLADPSTGRTRRIIHEESENGWVNVPSPPRWLKDGTFLWESERTGFNHLYRYDTSGKLLNVVTRGDWALQSVIDVNEDRGDVTFYGTKDGAIGRNAYRVGLDGRGLVRLTGGRGSHSIRLNGDGSLLIDRYSSLVNPGKTVLRDAKGKEIRVLSERKLPRNANTAELFRIKARDGEWLDVTVQKPVGMKKGNLYPVWIDTYSGPNAPTVRDSWRGTGGWYTQVGMALLQVNVRSASGRGQKFTEACYKHFGVQELKDIEDAVDWMLETYPWADKDRVGISGWSYGGFMTAFAMTHSDKFRCGVAGGGVYDWRLYDTIYTERYMAKPQSNPDGYDTSSVVKAAGNLHGDLLIVHGTMDDNVHMQNAIQFVDALQKAGKMNFRFMVYPKSRHGVRSPHLRKLRRAFIREMMGLNP